jgi:hypothetical protein
MRGRDLGQHKEILYIHASLGRGNCTYWTIEHTITLVASFLDMALESTRIQRFQKLKTT